jgi:aspartyl-tRNA(Asn)/glutamyl-tRNA(Gln) amidotransferase subunit A
VSLAWQSVERLLRALDKGEFSAAELREHCLAAIAARGEELNAFNFVSEAGPAGAAVGPLAGIPYASKANIAVRDQPLSCNSDILEGYRSLFHATVIERLAAAGARWIGQTNMDEFAMGSSCEHSNRGSAKNPWDLKRTPGGSSGGSAAAVAAGLLPFALGSDTGGSIRQPAGFCGIVGMKPTYGRVSRWGLVAFASSFDQIGPLCRSVTDAALVYEVLAGSDPRDATSLREPVAGVTEEMERGVKGVRIGVPWRLLETGVQPAVRENFERSLRALEAEGAELVELELPLTGHAIAAYYILAPAEASSNLARYDGVRYGLRVDGNSVAEMTCLTRTRGFGDEVKLRILLGSYVLSSGYYDAYYGKAQRVRAMLRDEHRQALRQCDAIVTPTSPTSAFALGERLSDPLQMYLSDAFTVPANLTGFPAIAIPSGVDPEGLPLSIHLSCEAMAEAKMFRIARGFERCLDFESLRRLRFPESTEAA